MFRKVTSLILTAMMLFLLGSPALAASAAESTPPTVDEILNEYHERCDAVRKADATRSDAAAMSLTTADQQLASIKADTIATLNAAGYEAYDVNPNTYTTLEQTLNTDFGQMGLESDGSYLVVISGEDDGTSVNTASAQPRATTGSSFEYTYNGVTYTMRYVTVSSTDYSKMSKIQTITVSDDAQDKEQLEKDLNAVFHYIIDKISEKLEIGSIEDLTGVNIIDIDTSSNVGMYTMQCGARWIRVFTQIYDSYNNYWETWGSVDQIRSDYTALIRYVEKDTGIIKNVTEGPIYNLNSSAHFHDGAWRKSMAVMAMFDNYPIHDYAGNAKFYRTEVSGGTSLVLTLPNPIVTEP